MKPQPILATLFFIFGGLLLANSALTDLVYDKTKTYSKGDAVIPSATEFTLYTAKASVPAGEKGPPNTTSWQTAEEYSTELQNTYSSTVSTPPSDTNINTSEIANLGTPTSTTTTPSGLSTASNRAFVMQQYLDFLGRDGDDAGITYWTDSIDAGTSSRADCVNSFVFSDEFQAKVAPLTRLYLAYFNRLPDQAGYEYWSSTYLGGAALNDISQSFAGSAEFVSTYGSLDDGGFVNLVYQNLFSRSADQGGYDYWTAALAGGSINRGGVMTSFSESTENINLVLSNIRVFSFYYGMLKRVPDQGGYEFWVSELNAGKQPNDLINGFISSTEYQGRF